MADSSINNSKPSLLEKFFAFKYVALTISVLFLLCGILGIVLGAIHLFTSIMQIIGVKAGKPGIHLIEAVDTFLFALVVLVLGGGIYKLFMGTESTFKTSPIFSKITNFKDLKVLLWETLLLTLTVWCALSFFLDPTNLKYEQLILPVSILLLAWALNLIKGRMQ